MPPLRKLNCAPLLLLFVQLNAVQPAKAYSVLTHEAIIDRSWKPEILPLLLARFPDATEEQLRDAHAYAYGGAILQDMGYYPFGSKFFSDLVHYTRSGDFVASLIRNSQDVNEYAFALGALAHYAADNLGHPVAINRAVPLMYPKLRARYGNLVTYEDDPVSHLKTEFSFDVIGVAEGQYAPGAYHDFIGFKVSKDLLDRAFQDTYSLPLKDLFRDLDLALGTYRYTVAQIIPEMTKTAWHAKKDEIQKLQAGITRRKFVYRLSRTKYEKEWDGKYEKPGFGARFLSCLFHIMPKIGPFKALAFKVPTPEAEKLFVGSFNDTMERYRVLLGEVRDKRLKLENQNFDTGRPTRKGEYKKADETYEKLLEHIAGAPNNISIELRTNILGFYGSFSPTSEKARGVLETLRKP
ncbi:MAG TPA: zinc dependent phospholipase C family protein [Bryobacteraceae bacterium]